MLGLAILLIALGAPVPGATQPQINALPNCQDKPETRPTSVVFACGDGGVYATGVRWSNWGAPFATASATMHANDCTPNCAQGHFHVYAAYLAATGSQRCPNGERAYAKAAYAARSHGTLNAHSRLDWFDRPCS